MSSPRTKPSSAVMEAMLDEASWLLTHAQALGDYGRKEEAAAELARAATCEEEVASLLEAAGEELEAAIHRVSAASCYQQIKAYPRAITLFRAALSAELSDEYRARVAKLLKRCLALLQKEYYRHAKPPSRRRSRVAP
jgi:tetratricopeptide (TPR) repeat protein